MVDKVDKFAKLTAKVNKAVLSDLLLSTHKNHKQLMQPALKFCLLRLKNEEKNEWLFKEYHHVQPVCILWQNFAQKNHCKKICFQKLFWVALDVCVGKNQLGGDKRDKIANIGAVECRTCHRKLSK